MNVGKGVYIEFIILKLNATTGVNFQFLVGKILSTYYQSIGKTYEMYSVAGGDDKNDGRVKEEALFYQIYSPYQYPKSFKSNVERKFKEDLETLFDLVYNKGKRNNKISKFVFIVNTRDDNLPLDSDGYYEGVVEQLNRKYKTDAKYQLKNSDYFSDLLYQLDESTLHLICEKLGITGLISIDFTRPQDLTDFIEQINNNMYKIPLNGSRKDYKRISSNKKIDINKLQNKKEHINFLITKCFLVKEALDVYRNNKDGLKKFDDIRNLFINLYDELSKKYLGEELYDKLLENILSLTPGFKIYRNPAEILMVYIFDRCDIFKKEN